MKPKSILIINTIQREKIEIGLYHSHHLDRFEYETNNQSKDILVDVETILKQEKKSLKDLRAVLVNIDPGSYTGMRVGVTVANTLAWSLDIPIFSYAVDNFEKVLFKAQNSPLKFAKLVLPIYFDV